ncbi:hypothetical protein [Vibrio alfacsensis]|uniref:hypothetical protein n=1 Tax=Vibrio alfacsensis TaxID=1074311 RepID=UPI004068A4F2
MNLSLDDYSKALLSSVPLACEMLGEEQLQRAIELHLAEVAQDKWRVLEIEGSRNFDIGELLVFVSACLEVIKNAHELLHIINHSPQSDLSSVEERKLCISSALNQKSKTVTVLAQALEKLTDEERNAIYEWVLDNAEQSR